MKNISDLHPFSKWIFLPFYTFLRRKKMVSQQGSLLLTNLFSGILHGLLVLLFKDYKQALTIGVVFTFISIVLSFVLLQSKVKRTKNQS